MEGAELLERVGFEGVFFEKSMLVLAGVREGLRQLPPQDYAVTPKCASGRIPRPQASFMNGRPAVIPQFLSIE